MKKICNIILAVLVIVAIIIIGIIAYTYIQRDENEKLLSNVVAQIEDTILNNNEEQIENKILDDNEEQSIKLDGYDYEIEGIVEIPKINIKYPIVNDSSENAMKVTIMAITQLPVIIIKMAQCLAKRNN